MAALRADNRILTMSTNPSTEASARWPVWRQLQDPALGRNVRLVCLAILVGVAAGCAAMAFSLACRVLEYYALDVVVGYHPPHPHGEKPLSWLPPVDTALRPWLLLVMPTLGGLACGILVFTLAPEAEGHGTDSVIDAYHRKGGEIRPRVPLVKIVASALTLGTGGSGGREGPIAQVGAGFASALANLLRLRPAERRILVAAGMGAGIAAIFRAPLAGALFAAEVLYRSPDFEPEVIIPAGISSVVSYCTFGSVFGWQPLFHKNPVPFTEPIQLAPYFLLAIWMIVLAMLYTRTFYGVKYLFQAIPMPKMLKPALGGLCTGSLAMILFMLFDEQPRVLGVMSFGYGILQEAINHQEGITIATLLAVALGKILTTSFTISSGGSGGVFGPSMVIGGCGGGALGLLIHQLHPHLLPHPSNFIVVGMAGFFAAAAKTPFSTIIMVSEITDDYSLLLPALWVCTLTFLFADPQTIYSAQVEGRGRSLAHQGGYLAEILSTLQVQSVLRVGEPVCLLHADTRLVRLHEQVADCSYPALPVVDREHRLLGMLNLLELPAMTAADKPLSETTAGELMVHDVPPVALHDTLAQAAQCFMDSDLPALPVIHSAADPRVVAILRRSDVAETSLRLLGRTGEPTT